MASKRVFFDAIKEGVLFRDITVTYSLGLRLIEEMDRLGFLNMSEKRTRNSSSDHDSVGTSNSSWCEASFESGSSGIGESISSTTIPMLECPRRVLPPQN